MSRTSIHATILASLVAAAAPTSALAAGKSKSTPQERSAAFVAEGDEAFERGDYEEAIVKYRAAYYGLTPEQRTSYIGSIPVRNAMRAYGLLLAERQDRRVLEQQLAFLTEFLESVRANESGVTLVGEAAFAQLEQTRTEAEQKLAALAQVVAPPPEDEDGEEDEEAEGDRNDSTESEAVPLPKPSAGTDDWIDAEPRHNWLGLGLAIGGGATAGIGAGVMVGWWTVRSRALALAEEQWEDDIGSPDRARYLQDQWYRARRHLIAGGVLVGLGAAAATAGTVIILVQRARGEDDLAWSLSPSLGSGGAGLQFAGRF